MSNDNKLIGHYTSELKSFRKCLSLAARRRSVEDIHQLRLSVKHLRATVSFMQWLAKKRYGNADKMENISQLFEAAGKVREAQVNLRLVTGIDIPFIAAYRDYLLQKQKADTQLLLDEIAGFDMRQDEYRLKALLEAVRKVTDKEVLKKASLHTEKKLKKVKDLLRHLKSDWPLHKIRIHLKKVAEILRLMQKVSPEKKRKRLLKKVELLNETIGDWHDQTVLITSVSSVGVLEGKNSKELKSFTLQLKKQNLKRRKKIKKQLQDFLRVI